MIFQKKINDNINHSFRYHLTHLFLTLKGLYTFCVRRRVMVLKLLRNFSICAHTLAHTHTHIHEASKRA